MRRDLMHRTAITLRREAEEAIAGLPEASAGTSRAAAGLMAGAHRQRKAGTGERFWQFREYDPSDRPQDIDWRFSARTDKVFVRQKELQTAQTILFWHAGGPGMDFASAKDLPQKGHCASVLALALALVLGRAGERVGLLGGAQRPGHTEKTFSNMAESLAAQKDADLPGADSLTLPPRGSVVLLGDFLQPMDTIRRNLDSLTAATENGMILQILDPAEADFPFDGRIRFVRPGSDEMHIIDHAESVREAYLERMQAHCGALRDYCRHRHWSYHLFLTGSPYEASLLHALEHLSGRRTESGPLAGGAL